MAEEICKETSLSTARQNLDQNSGKLHEELGAAYSIENLLL